MNKIILIFKREYLERVKKKSFILLTLLAPVGIGLLIFASIYFTKQGMTADKKILVVDESGIFSNASVTSNDLVFYFSDKQFNEVINNYADKHDLLLHIPPFSDLKSPKHNIKYFSEEKLSIVTIERIERKVAKTFKEYKITKSGIDQSLYNSFGTTINMENGSLNLVDGKEDKTSKLSTTIATVLGGVMGFLMYFVIIIYGGMVMRSVMEEKVSRIVELMISTVKPFQLMMGKLLGVGAVGLTQLAIWLLLIPLIGSGISLFMGVNQEDSLKSVSAQMNASDIPIEQDKIEMIFQEIGNFNWPMILPIFIIFFIGGYLIYSAMFAAVGSATGDDMSDTQQMMLPLIIPVIIAFMMLQGVISDPNGNMAIFGSMFPLFSPIIMPARLAFDPPIWQIVLSICILIASIVLFIWMAGKIYRTGILMYGKKVSFKEIGKWLFYK